MPGPGARTATAMRSGSGARSWGGAPDSTERSSAASAAVVAIGPASEWPNQGCTSPGGTTPGPGLSPTRPQLAAGMRIEPSPSEPIAIGAMRAATAAALPADEPPGVRDRSHGLAADLPYTSAAPCGHSASSGMIVVPSTSAPARRTRATSSSSSVRRLIRRGARAQPPRQPGDAERVLDRDWDAGQREAGQVVAPGQRGRLGLDLGAAQGGEGVDARLDLVDAAQERGGHVDRRKLAPLYAAGDVRRARTGDVVAHRCPHQSSLIGRPELRRHRK